MLSARRWKQTPLVVFFALAGECFESAWSMAEEPLADTVIEAFREVHDGWSVDEVLVNDDLNAAFIRRCRQLLPDVDEADLNWELLSLRKAGRLKTQTTRTRRQSHNSYFHAAEIAARFMYDKYRLSVDRVLCDPTLRTEFDRVAQQVAPEVSAYRLRKAGLALRKMRQLRPELVARVAEWDRRVTTLAADDIIRNPDRLPKGPGIYIFRDRSGYLYIGESSNLRKRVSQHLDRSDRRSLVNYLSRQGSEQMTIEIHAFDPHSGARLTELRRAYESELIRSRQPRFNVAP